MSVVTGDPAGVRSMSQSLGTTAAAVHGQGVSFAQACSTINPVAFAGGAGDRMRSDVSQLQAASAALAQAYDHVASFLPRVADAIEKAQEAEKAEQKAAQALSRAGQVLAQAQTQLAAANGAVAFGSPLSLTVATGPTPAQLAAQAAAQRAVQQAQHQVDLARQAFKNAQTRFGEAEHYRRSVLAYLTYLCQTEAQTAERALPALTSTSPLFTSNPLLVSPFAVSTLRSKMTSLLEVPTIAGSSKGGLPLLGYLMNDLRSQNAGAIQALNNYVTPPTPRPHQSGGGGGFFDDPLGWTGNAINNATSWAWHAARVALPYVPTVLVAGGSIALIIGTGGAATPVVVGIGGLTGTAGTAAVEALRHQKLDPVAMPVNGLIGAGTALVPELLPGAGLRTLLVARAGAGAAGSTVSQLVIHHRISLGTVAASGAFALNPLPGPGAIEGTSAAAVAAKLELGTAYSLPSWLPTLASSGPAAAHPAPASHPAAAGACPP